MKINNVVREIGSEFWSVDLSEKDNSIFLYNFSWYLSGRNALKAIISDIKRKIKFKSVAMPSWCCESMIKPFIDFGIEVVFYPVLLNNGKLEQDLSDVDKQSVLFLMDYFGYTTGCSYNFNGPIIRDVTHSIFSKKYSDADYYFGSLRKWSGFLTGGFAQGVYDNDIKSTNIEYVTARKNAMFQKQEYINGLRKDKGFLQTFACAEGMLDDDKIFSADSNDVLLAKKLDVEHMKKKRRENARYLMEGLSDIVLFDKLGENDCPLFVPILIPEQKRDLLRSFLTENKIYCPIHWPISKYHNLSLQEKNIYEQEISLICDQRYGLEEMNKIVKMVKKFLKE